MDRAALITLAIIVITGFLAWAFGHTPPPSTSEVIKEQAAILENACVEACKGQIANLPLILPSETELYTTQDATCITYGNALFCSNCGCSIVPNITLTAGNYSCRMMPGDELTLNCTTFINS